MCLKQKLVFWQRIYIFTDLFFFDGMFSVYLRVSLETLRLGTGEPCSGPLWDLHSCRGRTNDHWSDRSDRSDRSAFGRFDMFDSSPEKRSCHQMSMWCFLVVWNMFMFPYIGNNHPNWLYNIFQRGRYSTNQNVNRKEPQETLGPKRSQVSTNSTDLSRVVNVFPWRWL